VLIHLLKSQLPTQTEMVPLYEYMAAVSSHEILRQENLEASYFIRQKVWLGYSTNQ